MLSVVGSWYINTGKRSKKEVLEGAVSICTLGLLKVRVAIRGVSAVLCKSDFEDNLCLLNSYMRLIPFLSSGFGLFSTPTDFFSYCTNK